MTLYKEVSRFYDIYYDPRKDPNSGVKRFGYEDIPKHPWDWDPRKGPDPKVQVGTSPPYPSPLDPPVSHTMRDVVPSVREQLLLDAAAITGGERNTEYGDPIDNLTMTGKLKQVFWTHMNRIIGPAEEEALNMVLTKLGRLGHGAIKRDTYMDAAAYMAIAYEVAMLENAASKDWS